MRYRCPRCHSGQGLWEGLDVPGWRSVDDELKTTGPREVDWAWAEANGDYGCSECDWEGTRSQLEQLGIDGEPLPFVHPRQTTIAA